MILFLRHASLDLITTFSHEGLVTTGVCECVCVCVCVALVLVVWLVCVCVGVDLPVDPFDSACLRLSSSVCLRLLCVCTYGGGR